jgi:hypothetical protein
MSVLFCINPTWMYTIIDVEGGFLQGCFEIGKELFVEVQDGFGEWNERTALRYQVGGVLLHHDICEACQEHDG